MNTLLLIDGSYYVYRSYHAMPNLCNQRGEPTGAIYGFVKAVVRMLRHVQPTHAAVIWDGVPKRRQALQSTYKEHRSERAEEMSAQWPVIEKIVPMMGMKNLRVEDAESDDVMASYSVRAWKQQVLSGLQWETILATADKDLLQCVNESTFIYSTAKQDRGDFEFALVGNLEVLSKWGVKPNQLGDVLAIMGDESDNIKGVHGIGIKTAAKLIKTHGNLEALLASGDDTKGLQSHAQRIRENRQMIQLEEDTVLPAPLEDLILGERTEDFAAAMIACDIDIEKL